MKVRRFKTTTIQREFGNLNDGFGGKRGEILRSRLFKKSDSYKKFGPWEIENSERADDEINELSDALFSRFKNLVKDLETHPYQGSYGQHPLWEFYDRENECVVWSAELTKEDRVTYLIFKQQNHILITNILGHFVIDSKYAVRPDEKFEMMVEGVFYITGKGTSLTGKIKSGSIFVGDKISLSGKSYKIKEITAAQKTVKSAKSGNIVGIVLEGLDKNSVKKGDILSK